MLETREVELTVESKHRFVIPNTRSDEEAIIVAERMYLEDGELGDSVQSHIVSSEVVPADKPAEPFQGDKTVSMISSESPNFRSTVDAWKHQTADEAEWN